MDKFNPDLKKMKISIDDLVKPNPMIYWSDFTISAIFSWGLFYLATGIPHTSPFYYFLIFLSSISFYRAMAFTHELVHLRKGSLPGFSFIWHIFCGIPLLIPHFLYRAIHLAHHSKRNYGKETDGEYIGFGVSTKWLIFAHFLFNLLIPFLSVLRFMILAPISLMNRKLRLFVMTKMSFMGLRFRFSREIPTKKPELIKWYLAEFSCCLLCWAIFILLITKLIPIIFLFQWYAIVVSVFTLNSLRALGATHWYASNGGEMSFVDQIKDSISVTSRSLFTKILCPIGTQYHALHHMFPFIPYHSLGRAYDRLLTNFPEEIILRETSKPSLFLGWKEIWHLPRK